MLHFLLLDVCPPPIYGLESTRTCCMAQRRRGCWKGSPDLGGHFGYLYLFSSLSVAGEGEEESEECGRDRVYHFGEAKRGLANGGLAQKAPTRAKRLLRGNFWSSPVAEKAPVSPEKAPISRKRPEVIEEK